MIDMKSGAYVLREDVKNPKPWKGRTDWLSQEVWAKGTRFIVYATKYATYIRPAEIRGDAMKLAETLNAYDDADDARWCAVVHRVLPRLARVDDPELTLIVAARESGYENLFGSYALTGLLRTGKLTVADVVAAYHAEDAHRAAEHDKREREAELAKARAEAEAIAAAAAEAAKPAPAPAPKPEEKKPATVLKVAK